MVKCVGVEYSPVRMLKYANIRVNIHAAGLLSELTDRLSKWRRADVIEWLGARGQRLSYLKGLCGEVTLRNRAFQLPDPRF